MFTNIVLIIFNQSTETSSSKKISNDDDKLIQFVFSTSVWTERVALELTKHHQIYAEKSSRATLRWKDKQVRPLLLNSNTHFDSY